MKEKRNYKCANCQKEFYARRKFFRNENVYCGLECTKIGSSKVKERPSPERLQSMLKEGESYSSIGRKYGVSGNAVKKWFKSANIHNARTQPSILVKCKTCSKDVKKEYNQTLNDRGERKKNFFCCCECKKVFEKQSGKLANVTFNEIEEMLKTMSLRAVARHFGVHHTSLRDKFENEFRDELNKFF